MNLRIHIKTIPHDKQRYNTVGDWWWKNYHELEVRVSDLGDEDMEMTLADHEINEALACRQLGVLESEVDRFDKQWKEDGEPGDHRKAPYHAPHVMASICERAFAGCVEVDWNDYAKVIDSL